MKRVFEKSQRGHKGFHVDSLEEFYVQFVTKM